MKNSRNIPVATLQARMLLALGLALVLLQVGCRTPVGAVRSSPTLTYRQIHDNAVSSSAPSRDTQSLLHRFDQVAKFEKDPDAALKLIHHQAAASRDRGMLFALSELNYIAGQRLRHSVKGWEVRDPRDYYLASAAYAWFFLFGDAAEAAPGAFDPRFRTACDLYNYGLGWALTERHSTNAVAVLAGGPRRVPLGRVEVGLTQPGFPWPLATFDRFLLADHLLVRGLSVRNRQPGLGAALIGVTRPEARTGIWRAVPASVLLRFEGGLTDLASGRCRASMELYSAFDTSTVQIAGRSVPLETDTTVHHAYALNQSLLWRLGKMQFLSFEETIPSDVYLNQPYQSGKVPVVFVHGTFSSPVWWSEMANAVAGDPVLRKRCQFWSFIYNSGNPTAYSAVKLRESLAARIKELDPEGNDPALQQMVVIGHSQGGLLTKLTATDTGDKLLHVMLKTNRLDALGISPEQQASIRRYACYEALPSVKRVVFISTPHRGSYLAGSFARKLARMLVSLPSKLVNFSTEFAGLKEKLDLPKELRGVPTSLDSMSPQNPFLLALAAIPLAPGIKGHSIIAVKGEGDYHEGKDGLVAYPSAHVDYVESEFIVRGPHSCQGMPPTIEEVRRILLEHVASVPPEQAQQTGQPAEPAGKALTRP